ncbi:hypothetical protein VTL71DRAFT_11350 [Oculimacula yallundae]|uniref:Uncharacterized protein n=1 Tax=Oculimacula yallundae TaxID=86028 RepID=A0ABR4CPT4_9HELO
MSGHMEKEFLGVELVTRAPLSCMAPVASMKESSAAMEVDVSQEDSGEEADQVGPLASLPKGIPVNVAFGFGIESRLCIVHLAIAMAGKLAARSKQCQLPEHATLHGEDI